MDKPSQELEPYTIPSYSSWFAWNNIHEVERFSLREFFDGSSITRSPRIYKEYRDFIISKYREDPSRKLTFTEARKSLVGDISVLLKVFTFLEKWGLINFNVSEGSKNSDDKNSCDGSFSRKVEDEEDDWRGRVKVEEGAPYGVRVVAAPNSMKPLMPPPPPPSVSVDGGGVVGDVGESGVKWAPLASYSDVYGELMQQETNKGLVCGGCKENYESARYEYTKEPSFTLCEKCFKGGNYEDKLADDFKFIENINQATAWTEAETLLLLDAVLKHGDDWELVARTVQTKSKLECISRLIQLPFGDLMLGAGNGKSTYLDVIGDISNSKQMEVASNETQESTKAEDQMPEPVDKEKSPELKDEDQQNGDAENEGPPRKRVCSEPTSDSGNSLMKQVARISMMLGPHVTASAADAAISALCYENHCSREIFDDDDYVDSRSSPETGFENRTSEDDDSVEKEKPVDSADSHGMSSTKSIIQLNLRTRAATATALGGAAANAKLLADQEEREIRHLVSTMIEIQLKKLKHKMQYIEDLEIIMGKEQAQLDEHEESLLAERIDVLHKVIAASMIKSKEHTSAKYQTDTSW